MEEILASIRKIISEDKPKEEAAPEEEPAKEEPQEDPPEAEAQEVMAEPEKTEPEAESVDDILELTQMVTDDGAVVDVNETEAAPAPVAEAPPPAPEPEPEPAPPAPEPEPAPVEPPPPEDPLVSDDAAAAAKSAFSGLANALQNQQDALIGAMPVGDGNRTLENMVLELLRPMVKHWLDQNLPGVVEKAVEKEIKRISRRITDQ